MRVLVACGGTAGHIFPALKFLKTLKSKRKDLDPVIVVTKRKLETRIIPGEYRVVYVSFLPLRLSFKKKIFASGRIKRRLFVSADSKNIIAIVKFFFGTLQSIYIILRYHPNVVVGFGGYATFMLVFFARIFGIKTVIHEQNVGLGIANKFLARFVDKIAISFDQTRESLRAFSKKTVLTGNPKCKDLISVGKEKALSFFGFSKDKFTILVMGGSQGSEKINKVFLETLSVIEDKRPFQVIHLSGINDYADLLGKYKNIDISFKLFEFFTYMHYAYSAADLAITRAGATTIGEIIASSLPAVVIPYPLAYQHQLINAKVLVDRGAAILIEDEALNASILKDTVMDLFRDPRKIDNMRLQYGQLKPVACQEDLSDLILSLAG